MDTSLQRNRNVLLRAAAGDSAAMPDAVGIILRGIRTYIDCGGELDLARCCGLPSAKARAQFEILKRNYWLCAAAGHIEADGKSNRARDLSSELNTFLRVIWPRWKGSSDPPPGASNLNACLFHAVTACPERIPTSFRQILRIVGDDEVVFTERILTMKGVEVIEREARLEWMASSWLQEEFTTPASYVAFRQAEARGSIRYLNDKTSACNVTGSVVPSHHQGGMDHGSKQVAPSGGARMAIKPGSSE